MNKCNHHFNCVDRFAFAVNYTLQISFAHSSLNLIVKVNNKLCVYSSQEYESNSLLHFNNTNFTIENNTIIVKYDDYQVSVPYSAIILIIDVNNAKVLNINKHNNNILSIYNVSPNIINDLMNINDNFLEVFNKIYDYIISLSQDINKLKININLISLPIDIIDESDII